GQPLLLDRRRLALEQQMPMVRVRVQEQRQVQVSAVEDNPVAPGSSAAPHPPSACLMASKASQTGDGTDRIG
ncbi:hypothetical protein D0N87_29945, partial [Pseudomonas sp. ATCC 13867]